MIPPDDYTKILSRIPGIVLILKANPPHFTIVDFNDERAAATHSEKSAVVGKDLFAVFPDNPDDPNATGVRNLTASLMRVIETRQPHKMSIQKYDIPTPGTDGFEERYWLPENTPVVGDDGQVQYIIHTVVDVTPTAKLEKKQQEAEREIANLSVILARTHNAVIFADGTERIQWVNSAFISLFGLQQERIIGTSFLNLLITISNDNARCDIEKSISLRQPMECEVENSTGHGNWSFAKLETQPIVSESRQLIAFFAVITDISRIKKAESLILKNEQRNRFILGNISEGIAIINAEGVIQEITPSGQRLLEYKDNELPGKKWGDVVPTDQRNIVEECLHEITSSSSQKTIEIRIDLADQKDRWIEITYHNFLAEPAIGGIVLTFRDISERKIQSELLRESEQNYKYLFNNNPAAIFIWHPQTFRIVECNDAAQKLTGYEREELMQITVFDYRPKEEHDRVRQIVKELETIPFVHTGSSQLVTKSGDVLHTDNYHHRIRFYGDDLILALILDITDKVNLQQQIEIQKNRKHIEITDAVLTAQENERIHLGRELHDNINQILTTARLYIEYALAEEKMRIQLMESSRDFIITAIKEVRELSKALVPASLDENGLTNALEDLIKKVKALNTIEITTRYNFDEKKLSPKFKLAIFRIVQEQLNNIVKHSKASRVTIMIKESSADLVLIVADNGIGFDPGIATDGLGFKNIVSRSALFGGIMTVDSGIGKGCELQIRFVNQLYEHVDR
jgi:PAS domain S-box-containing protein